MVGKIETLKEKYGFVRGEDGESRFFIPSLMEDPAAFDALAVGAVVEFTHEESPRGPRASGVRLKEVSANGGD